MTTFSLFYSLPLQLHTTDLKLQIFYVAAATYYYQDIITKKTYPAEIGVAAFNLQDGLIAAFSLKINPGELPIGSAASAMYRSNKIHGYQVLPPNHEGAEADYKVIFHSVSEFLLSGDVGVDDDGGDIYPPIFVHPALDELKSVKAVLETICVEAKVDIRFHIYPLEHLLFEFVDTMRDFQPSDDRQKFASIKKACQFLLQNNANGELAAGCEFHNNTDRRYHCCLSKVKRWAGMIVELLR